MVCLGNICRSPIAQGVLETECKKRDLPWKVDSAGTNGYHNGEHPHPMSQKVCKLNGVDISHQRSRIFERDDFDRFDLIIPMADDVKQMIRQIAGSKYEQGKVRLLLEYCFPGTAMDVPDPWSRSEAAYHEVFDLVQNACTALIQAHSSTKQP